MSKRNFLTLVYPQERRSGLELHIRFFIWCQWLRNRPQGTEPTFMMERIFLAPHLPFSIIPRQLAQQFDLRLTPIEHEVEVSRQSGQLGLTDAQPRIATLRFIRHLTTPRCSPRHRTFRLLVLLPGPMTTGRWLESHLGADFLLENRMRMFLDYDRLRYRPNPAHPSQIQVDLNVPCGYLEYSVPPGPSRRQRADTPA
jgi:hypothetical protein